MTSADQGSPQKYFKAYGHWIKVYIKVLCNNCIPGFHTGFNVIVGETQSSVT